MKMALVEWDDSSFSEGWKSKENIKDEHISPCISCGFVLRKDKEEVVLALNISPENYSDTITIPMKCAKRIRYLKVGNGKHK